MSEFACCDSEPANNNDFPRWKVESEGLGISCGVAKLTVKTLCVACLN